MKPSRLVVNLLVLIASAAQAKELPEVFRSGQFRWQSTPPLIAPEAGRDDPCDAIKDPTVVRVDGRWHLFTTIRSQRRTHQIEYLSFQDWKAADRAERHVLKMHDGYFCAPQVFYFTPHKKWYLVYQVANQQGRKPGLLPAFSTSERIDEPGSWTKPKLLYDQAAPKIDHWIDFWVICDRTHAHLFATSNDGRMWRAATRLADFPHGWSNPVLALQGDIFEASATYRLQGLDAYLTIIEAQGVGGRRYFQAYLADKLDGQWKPLAGSAKRPFAAASNVLFAKDAWSQSISHGELLRAANDETLPIDPARLELLYQGVSDAIAPTSPMARFRGASGC